jgi:hypothetical protein
MLFEIWIEINMNKKMAHEAPSAVFSPFVVPAASGEM